MNSVLDFLEESAAGLPDKTAFADEHASITFRELEESAKRAAQALLPFHLLRRPVPVLMEKSVETIRVMMAVVYAGGFYVILDAQQPADRLSRILEVLDADVMISSAANMEYAGSLTFSGTILEAGDLEKGTEAAAAEGNGGESIADPAAAQAGCGESIADPAAQADGTEGTEIRQPETIEEIRAKHKDTDPLYVLFTSGSTGTPKGVVVSHRNVMDFAEVFSHEFGFTSEDVLGNQAPWDFDGSVKDIYTGLKTGATVQIIPASMFSFPPMLLDFLDERKVTTMTWAVSALVIVSVLDGLEYKVPSSVKRILFTGEVMPIPHLNYWRNHFPDAMFVNLYGPTEITCNCTFYRVEKEFRPGDVLPIGKAFPNESVFLLDENNHEVTVTGKNGEICVSGIELTMGYYKNPEQTAKAFMQNPLNNCYPETIYRTGDLGYYNEDGELCFSSRADFQIKHMGHRIELGEIEHALEKVDEVKRSCVLYDRQKNKIVCFYQGDIDKRSLSRMLGNFLPAYMVPNRFRQVDSIPVNSHGKIDRAALGQMM